MSDAVLHYRGTGVPVEDLALNECTIRGAGNQEDTASWWQLWALVARDVDGVVEHIGVPVDPRGTWDAAGPGGKTWGFQPAELPGRWRLAPSVNVLESRALHEGDHPTQASTWHHNVIVDGVPDGEPWDGGAP